MVPAEPHSTGAVSCASGSPDEETRLPLLSMVSCCRKSGK